MPTTISSTESECVRCWLDHMSGAGLAPASTLNARVLLIINQAATGRVLSARLRARGAEVLTVSDPGKALERLCTCRLRGRPIEMIVAHIDRGDAYQLVCLALMRELAPIVAVGPEPLAAACAAAGCLAFCPMPVDIDEFVDACAVALDSAPLTGVRTTSPCTAPARRA